MPTYYSPNRKKCQPTPFLLCLFKNVVNDRDTAAIELKMETGQWPSIAKAHLDRLVKKTLFSFIYYQIHFFGKNL